MTEKKWYESTTIWINVAGIIAIILDLLLRSSMILDPDIIAIIVAVLNIINRFRITTPQKVAPIEKSIL